MKNKDKDKKKKKLLVPFGLFTGALVLSIALYFYNKLKKNANVSNANVSDGNITASTIMYSGGGGGGTSSSIVAQNQALASVNAGTTGNPISLASLTVSNCSENANRTVMSLGVGITLKKNGTPLNINDTFIATDILTFDVASNVSATIGKEIFKYKANGVCGDSNVATILANITTGALQAFTFRDAYLNGTSYVSYASLEDARDKNLENSGFTNRQATVYTTSMDINNIAFLNAAGTVLYPEGNYFDDIDFRYFAVNAQGVMFLFGDADKDALNAYLIKEGYN